MLPGSTEKLASKVGLYFWDCVEFLPKCTQKLQEAFLCAQKSRSTHFILATAQEGVLLKSNSYEVVSERSPR
jgi:hypothetical protein